jgi:hypothetical protein
VFEFLGKMAKSKTIIVNGLTVVIGTLGFWAGNDVIAQYPEAVSVMVAAIGTLNVVLRLVTSIPVSAK